MTNPGSTSGSTSATTAAADSVLTPVLSDDWDTDRPWTIAGYENVGGYGALETALGMDQDAVIAMVKESGLRGRGGAGFPTGMKWGFIPQGDAKPHYLVVNADESEPGTCKDIPLMMASPHTLVEGAIISSYAIRANYAFIYVRGEVLHVVRRLQRAAQEAYLAGHLGKNIHGSGYDLELVVHAGAGAYICGEETALLDSLEGRRGQPRLRPPFPAVAGLYAAPTVINNVESIASVPSILRNGAEWFASMGTEKSRGMTLYSLSGHVTKPGQYEAPLGITLRQLLELAGGVREGHQLKFWTPGGSSTPILTDAHLDVPLDYEGVAAAGSMLGTKALQIFDETTCVVRAVLRWTEFYKHESCGKCTPCREGTWWLVQMLARLERGQGREEDLEILLDQCDNILGRAFCALGDGATSPITSSIQYFREEYVAHLGAGCPFCDKGGECPLQNQSMSNGRGETRYLEQKRTFPKPINISAQVLLDRERCVLCARCTRFSEQIAGDPFITMIERGALQQVGIYEREPFESYFSGNTIQVCPVGALTSAAYRFRSRPFDLISTPAVCEHCASGCALRTDHRRGKVTRRLAGDDPLVNEEWNCDKGRVAFVYDRLGDRITRPMVRDEETRA